MRLVWRLAISGLVIVSLLALPAQAVTVKFPSGWGSPLLLDNLPGGAISPRLAVDPGGNAIAVWQQADGTTISAFAARYTPSSGWGAPQAIESIQTGGANDPDVGLDASGNGTAVWSQYNGTRWTIFASRFIPTSGWGAPAVIDQNPTGESTSPRVAVAATGKAVAAWVYRTGTNQSLWGATFDPTFGWSVAAQISSIKRDVVKSGLYPAVAIDPSGSAVAAWDEYDGTRWNISASRNPGGSGWQAPTLLETENIGDANFPSVASDAAGNAVVIWEQRDSLRWNIWSNRYAVASSGWTGAQLVENYSVGDSGEARVGMNAAGMTMAIWESFDGSLVNVFAAEFTVGAGWGAATLLEENDVFDSYWGNVVINQTGVATAGWTQDETDGHSIDVARYEPARGWLKPFRISPIDTSSSLGPELGVDGGGNVVAAWMEADSGVWNIWANRFVPPLDVTAPNISLTTPQEGAVVTTPSVTVSGITEPGAIVVVNGLVADVAADGSFSLTVAVVAGVATINATAYDDWGNSASALVNLTFADPVPGMQSDLDSLRAELDNLNAALNATRSDLASARGELNSTAAALSTTTAELNDTAASLNGTRFQLSATIGELDAIRLELNATRYELAQARFEYASGRASLNQTNDLLAGIQASQNGLRADLDATKNDLGAARGNLSVATWKLDQTNAELALTRSSLSDASASLSFLTVVTLVGFAVLGVALLGTMRLMSRYLARSPAAPGATAQAAAEGRKTPRAAPKTGSEAASPSEDTAADGEGATQR